ncbi:MAG TPA: nitrile hydratase subunit beta [Caulobacteraceae bacterium]
MNGAHDMGGMHGLGPIAPPANEPVFHHPWEARVLAMTLALGAWGKWNIDASRHQRELIPGPDYLRMSYYEKWLTGLIDLAVGAGLVSWTEVDSGRPAAASVRAHPPLTAERVAAVIGAGGPATRDVAAPRTFAIGETVRARTINPIGHTRLPRYVRGRIGIVERDHGVHVFPDTNAHGLGERPCRLYGVAFKARELWGQTAGARDSVHLDLWDAYLEPA